MRHLQYLHYQKDRERLFPDKPEGPIPVDKDMTSETFQQLGNKYTLQRRIGVGGMAEVFKAKLTGAEGFEKRIVIKRLFPQFAKDQEIAGHFIAEARLAALLQHENIVQVYDFGELDGSYFIAMEYLAGRDLHSVIERAAEANLPVSLAQALFVTARVCEGMGYVHDLKDQRQQPLHLIHRDLSPHNVFITYEGRVKIIDFGVARADFLDNKTQLGMAKGKICYMSPEQLGAGPVDHRSDIFAIGILLYEMLSGQRMYSGDTAMLIRKSMAVEYARLETVRPGLPPAVYAILDRALEKDATRRYQRCAEMQEQIEEVLFGLERRPSANLLASFMGQLFAGRPEEEPETAGDAVGATVLMPVAEPLPAPSARPEQVGPGEALDGGPPSVAQAGRASWYAAVGPFLARYGGMKIWAAVGAVLALAALYLAWPRVPAEPLPAASPVAAEQPQDGQQPEVGQAGQPLPAPGNEPAPDPAEEERFAEILTLLNQAGELLDHKPLTVDNLDQAQELYDQVLDKEPGNEEARAGIDLIGQERRQMVDRLLARAEQAAAANRLTTPQGNNAYQFYREVLALEPENAAAHRGLVALADRYATMADAALRRMRLPTANMYCRQGLAIDPHNPRLLRLQQDLSKSKPEVFFNSLQRSFSALQRR